MKQPSILLNDDLCTNELHTRNRTKRFTEEFREINGTEKQTFCITFANNRKRRFQQIYNNRSRNFFSSVLTTRLINLLRMAQSSIDRNNSFCRNDLARGCALFAELGLPSLGPNWIARKPLAMTSSRRYLQAPFVSSHSTNFIGNRELASRFYILHAINRSNILGIRRGKRR